MLWQKLNDTSLGLRIAAAALLAGCAIFDCGCALPTGILRSRWAMEDHEYAEKYCDGAEKSDVLAN